MTDNELSVDVMSAQYLTYLLSRAVIELPYLNLSKRRTEPELNLVVQIGRSIGCVSLCPNNF